MSNRVNPSITLAEEEGIQPSVPLTETRQFSGLVTLATRPLLRARNLERRRGIEPRTPGLQSGRSPLAVAAHGTLGVIRTPNGGFGIRLPHHRRQGRNLVRPAGLEPALRSPLPAWSYGRIGRLGRDRTGTGPGLSVLPLPDWATSLWCSGRDSNSQICGSQPHASTGIAPPEHWWAVKDLNLGCSLRETRVTARRFRPLSQLPKRELSKNWRKAGDSNAYVPKDPGLANQWDTNYPSLPGKSIT